jgi:glycosyltransferase involved in cell wall biosynthesis
MKQRHPVVRLRHVLERWGRRGDMEKPTAHVPDETAMSRLRGHVDEPRPEERVAQSDFTVRGWCTWEGDTALAVVVHLNEVRVGTAAVGSEIRADVAAALENPKLAKAGWRLDVDARDVADEAAELSVTVWGEAAAHGVELDRFTVFLDDGGVNREVVASGFEGAMELPCLGDRVGPVFLLSGWVVHQTETIERLDVLVNGSFVGRARLGLARPELARKKARPEAALSGFEYWVDLSTEPVSTSQVKLQLVAWPRGGEPVPILERVVDLEPFPDPPNRPSPRASVAVPGSLAASSDAGDHPSRLNLVVFTHQLDYGGGQLWLEEFLLKSGAGSRYACTVISYKDGPLRALMEARDVRVHVTQAPSVDDFEQYEGRVTELLALVAMGGHNAALVNTASLFSGADVTTRLSLPTVWAVHESLTPDALLTIAFGRRIDPSIRMAARLAMAGSAALVFEAEATRRMYAAWESPGRSVVIPYGVDTQLIEDYCGRVSREEAKAEVGYGDHARILLVMGTVEHRKAQTRIAQAFANVATDFPDWSLVFVGGLNTPYSDALSEYLRTTKLGSRATVKPVDKDTHRWYRSADVLLSASDMESLPRSMLEAMCFGVTVVSASVYGIPELLDDGTTGFLFEANDLEATVSALRRVLSLSDQERGRVGEAGRRHVVERFDSSGYAEDLMALFDGLKRDPTRTPDDLLAQGGRRARPHLDRPAHEGARLHGRDEGRPA